MPVRRTAQAILAIIAVLAAGAASFRYLDRGGELFGERIEVLPAIGPVGISPIVALRGFKTKTEQSIYMCVGATSELGDCAKLGKTVPAQAIRSVPIPHEFPDGTDVAPANYVLRAGPDAQGQFPVRGSFKVIPFTVGHHNPVSPAFASDPPSAFRLGASRQIAKDAPCRTPVWLADGRLAVGSTIVDPTTGVTVQFSIAAAEIQWSPVGDKLAYITTDHKELRLAGPDGASAVVKVREARGLLSSLSWAPEGDRLAFIAENDPNIFGGPGPPTVNILNATNGNRTQAGPGIGVAWSSSENTLSVQMPGDVLEASTPDGARHPLTSGKRPYWGPGKFTVVRGSLPNEQGFLLSSDGKQQVVISGGNTCALALSPDGAKLAVVTAQANDSSKTKLIVWDVSFPGASPKPT